nr:aspartyl-phosphate phosphatase Spo0E family protein [Cytobacillus horneckiae]
MKIDCQIEYLRKVLIEIGLNYGFTNPLTLHISEKLDQLIYSKQQSKKENQLQINHANV